MDHIFYSVLFFDLKLLGCVLTYIAAKYYTEYLDLSVITTPKKVWHYVKILLVIGIIGLIATSFGHSKNSHGFPESQPYIYDPNLGFIVFFILLIPALIGIEHGMNAERRDPGELDKPDKDDYE